MDLQTASSGNQKPQPQTIELPSRWAGLPLNSKPWEKFSTGRVFPFLVANAAMKNRVAKMGSMLGLLKGYLARQARTQDKGFWFRV